MVHRERSTEDRRQILLTLTESGRQAAARLLNAVIHKPRQCGMNDLKSALDSFIVRATSL
jgi:DNA-binding MarR family transcriptional regulator